MNKHQCDLALIAATLRVYASRSIITERDADASIEYLQTLPCDDAQRIANLIMSEDILCSRDVWHLSDIDYMPLPGRPKHASDALPRGTLSLFLLG